MTPRDDRPFWAAGALLLLVTILVAVPATRALLAPALDPLHAQVDPGRGGHAGYSPVSLAVWALVGLVLAWAAYALVFTRLGYAPDRDFFVALAPYLVVGPLAHALLAAGAFAPGPAAYLATEPPIYLTVALLAAGALAAGRATRRPVAVPFAVGVAVLVPLVSLAFTRANAASGIQVGAILVLAAAPAGALAFAYHRWRPAEALGAVAAVVGAHALDGATTWMVLRDPFGLGFVGFQEKNPFSEALVMLSNGWPFFAAKLALPLVLLALLRRDETEARLRAFLLFAVFVLGFGPGMSNILQVVLG